ncbi:hypothetical protein WH96_09190 [Kiloniella spongiae]|uniref:Lipoprotein SmpA/OmlA domain-containing protein n=1 Tax=Kiloniella spongiae TaxID=1489064 RepID=A0A0H2MEP3_9PROT|nr:hypothetical protein [Kiloniella spongiae]KLN60666.1 hypothetical protein WH96_09190 [Kiloniella spongiae]
MINYKRFLTLIVLAITLSACGNAAKRKVVIVGSEPQVSQKADSEKAIPSASNVKAEAGDEEQTQELAALTYDAAPVEPDVNDDPKQLLGINTDALKDLLGTPSFIRKESPAEIWQYNAKDCVLDLVLYDAVTSYVEARDDQVRPMDNRTCLRRLLLSKQ